MRNDLPRYGWVLDSRDGVSTDETDPYVHVLWLLSKVKGDVCLADAARKGIESSLAFYWGSTGTGGGPFISPSLAGLLAQHQLGLDIGFYYEDGNDAA